MKLMDQFLDKGSKRKLKGNLAKLIALACAVFGFYHLYSIVYAYPTVIVFRGIHIGGMVALTLLLTSAPGKTKETRPYWIDTSWRFWRLPAACISWRTGQDTLSAASFTTR
jgi:TRAP-type uncharacterized transport system fused permease subunit